MRKRNHQLQWLRVMRDPLVPRILEAYLILLVMDVAVRLVGLLRLWKWVRARYRPSNRCVAMSLQEILSSQRAVRSAARRHLYPMRCLAQSLALAWLLGRRGVATDLRLGVSRQQGKFDAHAWLELDGVPINDSSNLMRRYAPLRRADIAGPAAKC